MTISRKNMTFAVRSVAKHGDTDVFPFPLENHWFYDKEDDVVSVLTAIDRDFDNAIVSYPVNFVRSLSAVGYHGFRGATQIDPIWNAYLLGLLMEVGEDIESARLAPERNIAFSYRFKPSDDDGTMFDKSIGWQAFQREALARSKHAQFVLSTDISDFYARVYHHRLENALRAAKNTEAARRITEIVSKLAPGGVSYGLPVGGNAARLLAELVLNRVDRLLISHGIDFCRFVDDYYIFASSRESAHSALVRLSDALLTNEGLTLSRSKTRLMTASEFQRTSPAADPSVSEGSEEHEARSFLSIRLRYDPYSPTSGDDYENLRKQLESFDVTGMLARELRKSRIDEVLVRQLVKALRYLDSTVRDDAIRTLTSNLTTLYPVFPTVTILLRSIFSDASEEVRQAVARSYTELVRSGSHITLVPANLAFALRIMAFDLSDDVEPALVALYGRADDMMIKRDIILVMARRRAEYWISDVTKRYATTTPWEKRALLASSYILGDEGSTWRDRVGGEFSFVDREFRKWIGDKNSGRLWDIPV